MAFCWNEIGIKPYKYADRLKYYNEAQLMNLCSVWEPYFYYNVERKSIDITERGEEFFDYQFAFPLDKRIEGNLVIETLKIFLRESPDDKKPISTELCHYDYTQLKRFATKWVAYFRYNEANNMVITTGIGYAFIHSAGRINVELFNECKLVLKYLWFLHQEKLKSIRENEKKRRPAKLHSFSILKIKHTKKVPATLKFMPILKF